MLINSRKHTWKRNTKTARPACRRFGQHSGRQGCGMPLLKDQKRGGTEVDGSKSIKFCIHYYENGKFTNPNITMEEMKMLVKGKLKEMGFPGFIARFFTRGIPKL